MRRVFVLAFVAVLLVPAALSAQSSSTLSITCENGDTFDNGIEVVIQQMRAGFTYTATAVGINGFDPVLAVIGEDGEALCSDDHATAARYSAELPTTDSVPPSNLSAQVTFEATSDDGFQDVSLVVGGLNDQSGEILLVLEGMGISSEDDFGDPLSISVTPEMISSGVPLTIYMITRGQSGVDPLIYFVDEDLDILTDDNGRQITCDDAGVPEWCWGDSVDLTPYSIVINTGRLPGWQYDSMLTIPLDEMELSEDRLENFLTFSLTSYRRQTEGQYLVGIHMGIGEAVAASGN